jgi:hypothetical protein
MAQSSLTVTPPNPTPPTNMSFTGATPPNVPNYTKLTYLNSVGVGLTRAESGAPGAPMTPNTNPPPFFDDGAAGSVYVFATNTAALASGTGATSGGTENTYPGTGTASGTGTGGNFLGAVPASSSVAHEAAGTETSSTGAGNINYTYPSSGVLDTNKMVGVGPALTAASILAGPNASHASSLSPATNPTLTSIATIASGGGTGTCTCTGTNFTRQSVINVNGISYTTTYTSPTTISATTAKKATPGTLPVYVITGGVVQTATVNWTFS